MEKQYLKDYKSPDFDINWTELEFDLEADSVTVTNHMELKRRGPASTLKLDGEKIKLLSITLSGRELKPAEYTIDDHSLTIPNVPEQFELVVKTQFNPKENTELSGLYFSGGYLTTQCEAEGFRRITYFIDRPDVMTRYHVTMRADKKKFPVLLSNGNRLSHKDLGDGRHEAEWEDPFKKPSYLFALVAGDLGVIRDNFTTMSGRKINLEIYAPHGKQDLCHHAMRSLKRAMRWDEERFGREYDLDDYMIVSMDDFNMGAMENKGLNIFNSRLVLANEETATDQDFHNIESVVGHEYFHNWTGNRVTLRDWFHLSLKEGLTVYRDQEFSADMTDVSIQRIKDVDSLRDRQFTEDAGPTAHPVRPESCYSVDNFYTSTIYEKGAEVIRMMATMVGRRGFRAGMDTYFARHDGHAVTIEDFVKAISEPNKRTWEQFRLWYSQAGTPEVEVQENYDPKTQKYEITLKQSCPPTPGQTDKKPFHIPLTFELFDQTGKMFDIHTDQISRNSEGEKLIELKTEETKITFPNISSRPVLSLNRRLSAPVNMKWDRPEADLFFIMTRDTDGFNRREAALTIGTRFMQKALNEIRAGKQPTGSSSFAEAYKALLDDSSVSPAFKALILTLPPDSLMIQSEAVFDADNFFKTEKWAFQSLAKNFAKEFEKIYFEFHGKNARSIEFEDAGKRSLKNRALKYWASGNDPKVIGIAAEQYTSAQNMTDRMEALIALSYSDSPKYDELLEDFHKRYRSDALILNKWFGMQSFTGRLDNFDRVKRLVNHPDFNIKNPNNVYALLGGFINNAYVCHQSREEIYPFIMDKLLEIDQINPQVAARLCGIFDYYSKTPAHQKAQLLREAKRAMAHPKLSKNCRELIEPVLTL
jgi:aminopeptidase N